MANIPTSAEEQKALCGVTRDRAQNLSREATFERIRAISKKLPPDSKFDRDEANAR